MWGDRIQLTIFYFVILYNIYQYDMYNITLCQLIKHINLNDLDTNQFKQIRDHSKSMSPAYWGQGVKQNSDKV